MQQSFKHILDITLKHGYFKDKVFRTIHLTTADDTLILLRNLGIVLKPFSGGISLFAANTELLKTTDVDLGAIRLYLYCNDPYYINYTDFNYKEPARHSLSDTIVHFNNLRSSLMNKNEFVSEEDVVPLSFGIISIPEDDVTKTFVFKDSRGQLISGQHFRRLQSDQNIEFMISNLQEGLIRIFEGNLQISAVYYVPTSVWKKPMGIVEIYIANLYNQHITTEKVDYTIQFKNRHTIWKYFLVDPEYQKFKKLQIIKGNDERIFNSPIEADISGNKAWVFESKDKLPLLEFSDVPIKLVNGDEVNSPDILNSLPRASPEQLFQENNNNTESMYSHIYL
jgi:hypothetical protein